MSLNEAGEFAGYSLWQVIGVGAVSFVLCVLFVMVICGTQEDWSLLISDVKKRLFKRK